MASRIGNVQNEYKIDGNWERELAIESSSFAASAWLGGRAIAIGARALMFLTIATPAGWVGLIVVGAAVSLATNYIAKEKSGNIYDNIMKWLNTL